MGKNHRKRGIAYLLGRAFNDFSRGDNGTYKRRLNMARINYPEFEKQLKQFEKSFKKWH